MESAGGVTASRNALVLLRDCVVSVAGCVPQTISPKMERNVAAVVKLLVMEEIVVVMEESVVHLNGLRVGQKVKELEMIPSKNIIILII